MTPPGHPGRLERNLRLYPLYQVLFNCFCWLPVFFLYFSEHLSLPRVLQLEAIYYATVVALEVPSGYFSDTVGRRRTLLVSSSALAASYALFFFGHGFGVFVIAQVCLAIGISFNSGTDTVLHFDSLAALGRGGEYAGRQANSHRYALLGRSMAALAGGVAGTWQLRYAYGLSLVTAVAVLVVVTLMVEPGSRDDHDEDASRGFLRQLGACVGRLRDRRLAWLFGFAILMIVFNHVPYELYQPYIDLLLHRWTLDVPGRGTPLVSGVVTTLMMLIASLAVTRSIRWRDRFGLATTLLATTAIQVAIIAAMGLVLHELVLVLVLLRSVPAAVMEPPMRAAITPTLPRSLRATYLSMQSLAGRLAFAGTLLALAAASGADGPPDWPALSWMSRACAIVGVAGLVGLAVSARACLTTDSDA